jgi:adenosylhomocysteinase
MLKNAKKMKPGVYTIPDDVDREIAKLKLSAMGVKIDKLTKEQAKYLASWEEGT